MTKAVHYKSLDKNGVSCHGGGFQYDLPIQKPNGTWIPGKWTPPVRVEPCVSGYHTFTERDATRWLHDRIFVAEVREAQDANTKFVSRSIRLIKETHWSLKVASLFAIQCALDVLPLYEAQYPDDFRISNGLVAAWEFVHGFITKKELEDARIISVTNASSAIDVAYAASSAIAAYAVARREHPHMVAYAVVDTVAYAIAAANVRVNADALQQKQRIRVIKYFNGNIPLFPEL